MLHCVAVCCGAWQCVVVCCSMLQCIAVCGQHTWNRREERCGIKKGGWQCGAVFGSTLRCVAVCRSVLQCVAVRCRMLQCVAVCCSALQRVAVHRDLKMADLEQTRRLPVVYRNAVALLQQQSQIILGFLQPCIRRALKPIACLIKKVDLWIYNYV